MTARLQILFLLAMILIFAGCSKSYDEKIAGVEIPIPRGMKKSDGAGVEVALLGFGRRSKFISRSAGTREGN
jgi:hypothetical protein